MVRMVPCFNKDQAIWFPGHWSCSGKMRASRLVNFTMLQPLLLCNMNNGSFTAAFLYCECIHIYEVFCKLKTINAWRSCLVKFITAEMILKCWKQLCVLGNLLLTSWTMEILFCLHSFLRGSRDNRWYYSCTWNIVKDLGPQNLSLY